MKLLPLLFLGSAAQTLRQYTASESFHNVHVHHHDTTIDSSNNNSNPVDSVRSLAKQATITKTFKFKSDFFLKFDSLPIAIGPDDKDDLLKALEDYAETFRDVWVESLMSDLPEYCGVEVGFILHVHNTFS